MPESDLMKSFKVATFEYKAETAPRSTELPKPQFWEALLKPQHDQLQIAEGDRLGKGKRARKHV